MKINEARLNVHMQHAEDLVLLGRDGVEELNNYIEQAMNNGEVRFTNKIDGCLAPETLVCTTEGDIPFSKLISDYMNLGKIYTGYGIDDNTDGVKEVQLNMPRVCLGEKNWCNIEFDNGSYIIATEDHPFRVGKGLYINAKDLMHRKIDGV